MSLHKKVLVIVVVLAIAIVGTVTYVLHMQSASDNSDIYYDSNGCAQSRSGGIHPDHCIEQ